MNSAKQELFKLTADEQKFTTDLQAIINKDITSNGGVIPFNRYMELALYYPELGYYSNPLFKFGANGDFVTAPLISNLFGHLLARQIDELLTFGVVPNILEVGAGNGKLAVDILATIGSHIENYYILELSANLAQWQSETIKNKLPQYFDKFIWLTELPDNFDGVILANEVLDAQPCNIIQFNQQQISEIGVSIDNNGRYYFNAYSTTSRAVQLAQELKLDYDNYQSEVNLVSRGFVRTLADRINCGAILLIDYGYGSKEYYHPQKTTGTLRGFYRQHVLDNILDYPGLCDITASVNWSSIVDVAINSGLEFIGYTTQAHFLINCGLSSLMANLKDELSNARYLQLSNQVNKLISPNEMGECFKVCGFSKNLEPDSWLGFNDGDRSYNL